MCDFQTVIEMKGSVPALTQGAKCFVRGLALYDNILVYYKAFSTLMHNTSGDNANYKLSVSAVCCLLTGEALSVKSPHKQQA